MTWRGQEIEAPDSVELSNRNIAAYLFDQECKAVNDWPNDPIVRNNARVIRQIERLAEMRLSRF